MPEWSNGAVSKTVERAKRSEGSNPSLSASLFSTLRHLGEAQNSTFLPKTANLEKRLVSLMVSRKVSSVVSLEAVRQERRNKSSAPPSGTQKTRKPKRPSPGPNLVRSGNIYLFQVRWPKQLDPERRAAPIRISLGACPHREARRQADLLIGCARELFGRTGLRGVTEDNSKKDEASRVTDDEREPALGDRLLQAELIGEMRAYQRIIATPPSPDSPEDQKIHAAMRGFVGLAKEIADPETANPLVIDNFAALQTKYTDDLHQGLDEKCAAPQPPDPKDETARKARALADGAGISAGHSGAREEIVGGKNFSGTTATHECR